MVSTTTTVTCRHCRQEFTTEVIDGTIQCTDGSGLPTCDDCYDDVSGYGRTQEKDAPFNDTMAMVVRYLRPGGYRNPRPSDEAIDLAVTRGYVRRRVVDFPGKSSTLYTEVTPLGEHMLYHYPDGEHTD